MAFQVFFRRVKSGQAPGFPRFKPMSRLDSFSMTEMAGLVPKGAGDRRSEQLGLKGVPGPIRVRLHRPMPAGSRPACRGNVSFAPLDDGTAIAG